MVEHERNIRQKGSKASEIVKRERNGLKKVLGTEVKVKPLPERVTPEVIKNVGKPLCIAELGTSLIQEKAAIVKDTHDIKVQELINDMIATVQEVNGVGIAAPQVYQSLRIFIVFSNPSPRYPEAPTMNPLAVVNPKIISYPETKEKDWEGCLSVPGFRALVPRYTSVKTEYLTRNGKQETKEFTGFMARIFQHEFDHLEGKVFLDRVESKKDIISERKYQRMFRKTK